MSGSKSAGALRRQGRCDRLSGLCLQGRARGSDEGFDGDPLGTLLASLCASNPVPLHAGGPQVGCTSGTGLLLPQKVRCVLLRAPLLAQGSVECAHGCLAIPCYMYQMSGQCFPVSCCPLQVVSKGHADITQMD